MNNDISGTSSVSYENSNLLIVIERVGSFSGVTLTAAPHQEFRPDNDTWFWTESWQAQEREADQDLLMGNYEDFDTMDDFIASL